MLECLLALWPTSLITQCLVVGVAVGLAAYFLLKKRYRLPPGPRGLPFVGNIFALYNCQWCKKLQKWSDEYGPVMRFTIVGKPLVVLSNIDVTLEALVKRGADITGRSQGPSGDVFTEGGSDIFNATYGPRWKLHRKLASKAVRNYLTGGKLSKDISESLAITSALMKKETGPFDILPYLSLLSFNILSAMCFSKTSTDTTDERFGLFVTSLDQLGRDLRSGLLEDFVPLARFCPTAKFKRFTKACLQLQDGIAIELEEHKRTFSRDTSRDFLDMLLLAQMEAEKDEDPALLAQITDTHVRQTVQDVFFAGVDASRGTLHWTLLLLALRPDIQEKVHAEVDSVVGADLVVDVSDRGRLCYTEAVLHEVMRMRPAAPIGVPHVALVDTTVGGYDIPKGAIVGINHYALHFDPDQWEDAYTFKPERFLDASGKMGPKPDSWLPFSTGRRVCLGETIAKPQLHLLLAGLCRAFTIELAPGTTHDFEPVGIGFDMYPGRYSVVAKPRI